MATHSDGTRDCKGCGKRLPLDDFWFESKKENKRHYRCKGCHGSYIKDWVTTNGENRRAAVKRYYARHEIRFRRYGLTQDEYDKIISAQNYQCPICLSFGEGRWLHIDHCHLSGRRRGLICSQCNTGIGKMRDSSDNLLRAARYLISFNRMEPTDV